MGLLVVVVIVVAVVMAVNARTKKENMKTAFGKLLKQLTSIIVDNPDDANFFEMAKRIFNEEISDVLGLTMKSFQLFIIDFNLNRLTDSKERLIICDGIFYILKNSNIWKESVNFMLLDIESVFTPCSEKIRILGDSREIEEIFAEGFLKRHDLNLYKLPLEKQSEFKLYIERTFREISKYVEQCYKEYKKS
jgi:hypothetical protein